VCVCACVCVCVCVHIYRLETALRSAFAQEQALRQAHADNKTKWSESSAGLRDTISKVSFAP